MKIKFLALVLIIFSAYQISCSTLETKKAPANPEWEEVEKKYKSLESEGNFAEMEAYSNKLSAFEWAKWQTNQIKFMLGTSLYMQQKYAEALKVFSELKDTAPFTNKTHIMAGAASLAESKYNDALKWIFSVYLKLEID